MDKMEIKKKLLQGLMGNMDDMAVKKFKKPDLSVDISDESDDAEVGVESEGNPLRQAAKDIYEALNGPNPEMKMETQTPEDVVRKESEQKIKDMKMDKLAEALKKFVDSCMKG